MESRSPDGGSLRRGEDTENVRGGKHTLQNRMMLSIVSEVRRRHRGSPLPTSPAACTAKANKRVQFGYGLNYMIDVEHAIIVDVEATPARTYDEVAASRIMIDLTEMVFS